MKKSFNVLDHVMVPDHQVMSEREVEELFAQYRISHEQLPRIYHDDPAVRAIGAKVGDVIRITRQSQTAGIAEYYRIVIKRPKK
ncbi:MAG: DNA-directed RNA polymerase subunit H [Methanoculleaceae archaeon]